MTRRARARSRAVDRTGRARIGSVLSKGFSLIEVLLVLAVLGILLAMGLPGRRTALEQARDVVARANIRNVLFAELQHYGQYGIFTSDARELLAFEPGLSLHTQEAGPGSVYVVLGQSRAPALCLFASGSRHSWHTLYYSGVSGGAVSLSSPEECTRRMLDEQSGQRPMDAPAWRERVPGDTMGPASISNDASTRR